MTDREPGLYWVKIEGEWEPASTNGFGWTVLGTDYTISQEQFQAIGPRIKKLEDLT